MLRMIVGVLAGGLLLAPVAGADECVSAFGQCRPAPWNGQLMPTWNTPGYYGGWTNTPVVCDQFSYQCRGYANEPNGATR